MKRGPKPWATLDESTLQKAAAAWKWLHYFRSGCGHGLPEGARIGDAMMSKFAPHGVILKYIHTGMVVASLGNRTWDALGLPLQ